MGKGDRRTKRGKIRIGTFGNSRRKRPLKSEATAPKKSAPKKAKPKKEKKGSSK